MDIPIIGQSQILKPNARCLDNSTGTLLERYMGTMAMGFITPKGIAKFTFANATAVRHVLRSFENMINKIDDEEETPVPGVIEERLKRLATQTDTTVHVFMVQDGDKIEPEFEISVDKQEGSTHVQCGTPPFKFLSQAILSAENMVSEWTREQQPDSNGNGSGSEEKPTE